MATHDKSVPHSADCTPDNCMRERARYWRNGSGVALQYTYGQENFHGPTIRERQEKIVSDAAKEGRSVRQVNPVYDRVGSK